MEPSQLGLCLLAGDSPIMGFLSNAMQLAFSHFFQCNFKIKLGRMYTGTWWWTTFNVDASQPSSPSPLEGGENKLTFLSSKLRSLCADPPTPGLLNPFRASQGHH